MNESERIRRMLGVSRAEFSRRYGIPVRTLEEWDAGRRTPPDYVVSLLERCVKEDMNKEDTGMEKGDKRTAKDILADAGIKVYQKDIKDVKVHKFNLKSPDGEIFPHRYLYRIELNDGRIFNAYRETVDRDGNFNLASAKFMTKDVHEI